MVHLGNIKPIVYSIYQSVKGWHPVAKGLAITALALAVWKYATREPSSMYKFDRNQSWDWQKNDLKGSEQFLQKLQSIYTLDRPHILNTNLEQQPLPNCLQVGFNQIAMKFGYADGFAEIRATKVLEKIKEFIEEFRDDIYLNQKGNIHLFITDSLKRIGTRYKEKIEEITTLAKTIQPFSWKVVQRMDDKQIEVRGFPFIKEI